MPSLGGVPGEATAAALSPSRGRRSTRGQKAAAIAVAAAAAATAAALPKDQTLVVGGKLRAAAEPNTSSPAPIKRSRRLAVKHHTAAVGASAAADGQVNWENVPNRTPCTLLSELGMSVATARLVKNKEKISSRWIDNDLVAVELDVALDASVSYPYSSRYPIPGGTMGTVDLDTQVGTVMVWSRELVSFS